MDGGRFLAALGHTQARLKLLRGGLYRRRLPFTGSLAVGGYRLGALGAGRPICREKRLMASTRLPCFMHLHSAAGKKAGLPGRDTVARLRLLQ